MLKKSLMMMGLVVFALGLLAQTVEEAKKDMLSDNKLMMRILKIKLPTSLLNCAQK